jgi:hypothetical protein
MASQKTADQPKRRRPPAKTYEAREKQLISAAVDLAEKQILAGTASSQVITHYLKLGSTTEHLEREKLLEENKLLRAKTKALQSVEEVQKLYADALNAMRKYSGGQPIEEGDSTDDQNNQ